MDQDGQADGNVPLMAVYSWSGPPELEGSERTKIADIVLKTKLYTSKAGDNRLFFQHDRVNIDRRKWPSEWRNYDFEEPRRDVVFAGIDSWPEDEQEAKDRYIEVHADTSSCPFAWLLPFSYADELNQ